ncbi:MAG: hypothetical protein HGA61_05015, partial [Candidatus Moranbacteria bacterium]|nr:hypothetical protein [Candidatus Moranbacteria bacterium]
AMQSAFRLRDQFRRVFMDGSVCPVVVGMETSNEELTFYDEVPEKFIRSMNMVGMSDGAIYEAIQITMGRFIPSNVKKYILRLIKGNIEHMSEHEEAHHEVSMDHHEFAICFGRGFQWIPPHRGIIINPSFNSLRELLQAVDIQAKNQEKGRVKNGCLLVVCTPYREIAKIPAAKEQTRDLTHFALKHIWSHRPDVHSNLRVLSVIVNVETKELTLFDMDPETLEFKPLEPIAYSEIESGERIVYTK